MRYPTFEVVLVHNDDTPDEKFEVYIDLMLDEADSLMRWTGMTWGQWVGAVDRNEPDALRFLYWLGRKRSGNPIDGKFSDITFWLHNLSKELSDPGDFQADEEPATELTGPDPTEGDATASS